MSILTKIANYLDTLKCYDNFLIIHYHDGGRVIRMFCRDHDGTYTSAARHIYSIFCTWVTYDGMTETVEDLFDLCADENDFGDILDLYAETENGDFKHVYGDI